MMIRAIITGATGMVGEGVLHECLQHPDVEHILVVGRKTCGVVHPKLSELLVPDFYDLSAVASQLTGYNACFFCLGVSSVGMNERDYYRATYTLTLHMATLLSQRNGGMTFCYVSGVGTDSTEMGSSMWARVKGKTENDLMALPFKQVYNFRPGYIHPTEGLKNTKSYYRYLSWLYPVLRRLFPNSVITLRQLGLSMIHSVDNGTQKRVLEVKDILALAEQ
ncbi:NAD-dependent epimerase/dehydratase family protein [Fibrella aquatilis]|uniref:Epimerase n=1 Tax=Fibrella aquatilis TaxID=2817059 RepID=A0A939JXF8_9BACT|nr:NAD-dependent epimerase/dehydratase family protein [Fibrella aquatilis]MBO0930984.1 epimerase [Fibrella aquatilis]